MPIEACSGLWRSEDMVYLTLQMQREVAHDAVLKLGEIGQFQFQDLNADVSAFQRDFVQEVRRCDDMDRKLRYLHDEIQKVGAVATEPRDDNEAEAEAAAATHDGTADSHDSAEPETMFSLEQKIDERYHEVVELNEQYQALMAECNRLKEHVEVLQRTIDSDSDNDSDDEEDNNNNDSDDEADHDYTAAGSHHAQDSAVHVHDSNATERDVLTRHRRSNRRHHSRTRRNVPIQNINYSSPHGRADNSRSRNSNSNHHNNHSRSSSSTHVRLRVEDESRIGVGSSGSEGLMILTGVLPRDRVDTFERVVFRASRGNFLLRCDDMGTPFYYPPSREPVYKTVFVLYFSAPRLRAKLQKLCEVNGGTLYRGAEGGTREARAMRRSLRQQLLAVTQTLQQSARQQCRVLASMTRACDKWRRTVATEGAVFATMNRLRFTGSTAVAQGWAPLRAYEDICAVIAEAEYSSGAQASTIIETTTPSSIVSGNTTAHGAADSRTPTSPPTYFKTNKYTESFQSIVNSYGMARYKEVNPGVFTIVTFPYLFGVMYGDVGHGLLLTALAVYLVCQERYLESRRGRLPEMLDMIFGGRYLLLLMGLFAVYMGVLYNDMFGFSLELFRSGYVWPALPPGGPAGVVLPLSPSPDAADGARTPVHSVSVGIDSAWAETENKLEFYNSIKMKCSVMIGVVQMLAGVCLSWCNYRYFHEDLELWFRFVPEVVFLLCTFGYMCVLIVLKWCIHWEKTSEAPSLLETMTNFFLAPGTVSHPLYRGQAALQVLLLLVAVCCVPCMLCVIPYKKKQQHDAAVRAKREARLTRARYRALHEDDTTTRVEHGGVNMEKWLPAAAEARTHLAGGDVYHTDEHDDDAVDDADDGFDLSEIIIHQMIHTIEYVLGCVSNTASYLRLWALSLAHSQLSEVFWNFAFLLMVNLDGGSGVFVFMGFAVWLLATIGVLLGMESLSAFLHALRLHWVEFNNKFYSADGHAFEPFDLADTLNKL